MFHSSSEHEDSTQMTVSDLSDHPTLMEVSSPSGSNTKPKMRDADDVPSSAADQESGNRRQRIQAQMDAYSRRYAGAQTTRIATSVALANAGLHVSHIEDDDDDSHSSRWSSGSKEGNSGGLRGGGQATTTGTATATTTIIHGDASTPTTTTRSLGVPRVLLYQPAAPPQQYQLQNRDDKRSLRTTTQQQQSQQQHGVIFPGAYGIPRSGIVMVGEAELEWQVHTPHPSSLSQSNQNNDRTKVMERKDDSSKQRHRTRLSTFMIVLMVVVVSAIIVAVVVAVVVTRNNQNSSNNGTSAVKDENTDKDEAGHARFSKLRPFLLVLNPNGAVAWDDAQSPQGQALEWLIYEDVFTEAAVNVLGIPDIARIQTRYALAVLFFATGGVSSIDDGGGGCTWRNTFNFTSPLLHECDWSSLVSSANGGPFMDQQGVICNDRFEVTAIVLENNGLHGSLPEELASILTLEVLRLTHNELTGRPPVFAKLQVLDLSVNRFHGSIVMIRRVGFVLQPTLLHLNVSHNLFNGSVLQEMVRVESDNESPYSRFQFQVLDLSNCLFTGALVGEVLAPLSNLETFRINDNDFTGSLPSGLSLLTALSEFSASGNQLEGNFPWSHLASAPLTRVEMSNNQFTGDFLPTSSTMIASSLPSTLEYLDFSTNNFGASNTSTIPESIGQLSQLQVLLLANNEITGTLPSTLGDLAFLRKLDVSNNSLMGTLPSQLANCELLEELVLNGNLISGTIPQGYAQIPHLVNATFHSNTLSGDISFLCTARDGNSSTDKIDSAGTAGIIITADCLGESPDVECAAPCCDCHG